MSLTCATCPLARQIEGNRYACSASHNHHNQVVRGHWEATQDCQSELEAISPEVVPGDTDADYVMAIEASLERHEVQINQQEQFAKVTATTSHGVEIDSIKPDSYRVWFGMTLMGTIRRTTMGWLARPKGGQKSWHKTPELAQQAVLQPLLC